MAKNAPSTTRIYQLVFGLAFLFISYGAVRTMMFGSTTKAKQIGFMAIAFAVVMWLDKLYWLVLPLCMMLNVRVPGLPFDSAELGCIALIGIHFIRTCLHRDTKVPWNRQILAAFPLFFWICIIWAINPAGMNIFGTSTMGGRFYFKIVLGFLSMVFLSAIRLGESECKLLFRVLVFGSLLSIVLTVTSPGLYAASDAASEAPGSRYVLLSFSGLYYLVWSRYSLPEILSSLRLILIAGVSMSALALSGKRNVSASIGLYPIYRALLTGKHLTRTLVIGILAFMSLSLVVAMDGQILQIPESTKRSLAMIYPKYRSRAREGLHDTFRDDLRIRAREIIRNHPWVGRRGFRLELADMSWLVGQRRGERGEGHAYTGSWHSAIYAYAADFGLPCLVFFLLFVWFNLRFAFRYARRIPCGTYASASFLYYALSCVHGAVCMYTSGHSSFTTFDSFLRFGMLIAIANGFEYKESPRQEAEGIVAAQ